MSVHIYIHTHTHIYTYTHIYIHEGCLYIYIYAASSRAHPRGVALGLRVNPNPRGAALLAHAQLARVSGDPARIVCLLPLSRVPAWYLSCALLASSFSVSLACPSRDQGFNPCLSLAYVLVFGLPVCNLQLLFLDDDDTCTPDWPTCVSSVLVFGVPRCDFSLSI